MAGIPAMTKLSTLNFSRESLLPSLIEFPMQWLWKIRSQNRIFHLIFITTWFQMKMRILPTSNKFQEQVLLRSATKECLSSPNSRVATGPTVIWLLTNVSWHLMMRVKVKIAHNILREIHPRKAVALDPQERKEDKAVRWKLLVILLREHQTIKVAYSNSSNLLRILNSQWECRMKETNINPLMMHKMINLLELMKIIKVLINNHLNLQVMDRMLFVEHT